MSKWTTGAAGLASAVASAAVLSGCAAAGSGQFSCPGRPAGVRCASAVEVYRLTEESDRMAATAGAAVADNPARAAEARAQQQARAEAGAEGVAGEAPADTSTAPGAIEVSAAAFGPAPLVDRPTPVRTPAQVMRVWVAPWEDTKGVLHVGGYHYLEVVARRWSIGGPIHTEPARVFSIDYDDSVFDPAPVEGDEAASASGTGPAVFGGTSSQVNTTGN